MPAITYLHSVDFHTQLSKSSVVTKAQKQYSHLYRKKGVLLRSTLQSGGPAADVSNYSFRDDIDLSSSIYDKTLQALHLHI